MLQSLAPSRRLLFSATARSCARSLSATASSTAATTPGHNHPYLVSRNSRGSLPVYTDIRNAGTRHQTLIRNVHGDVKALVNDLASDLSLSPHVRVDIAHQRHIVFTGGLFKREVVEWLRSKGF